MKAGDLLMRTRVLQEKNYAERMQNGVEPYLAAHAEEFYWERESGHPIHVLRYRAFRPRGVVVISHGFTENAEKYKEIVYYFIKEHFHVYLPEHCGHGKSYRLVEDPSLVYVDSYHRYVEDLLFVARKAKAEACGLPLVLYSHSMGGGIAERGTQYVVGQKPYQGIESFKQSSSLSRPRFLYYQQKREKEPLYHLNAASYGWLHAAAHLYRDLMRSGWKRIEAPVLLFQAENDHLVSNRAQERMIRKMAERRPGMAKMVKVPGAKHELFGTRGRMLQTYWNMVFAFLEKDL
jgi:lysophospholipase